MEDLMTVKLELPDDFCGTCGKTIKLLTHDIQEGHYLIKPTILITTCRACLLKKEEKEKNES